MSFFCVINGRKFKNFVIGGVIAFAALFVFCFTVFAGMGEAILETSSSSKTPIFKGNEKNSNVSLMINVYWGNEYIEPMLEIIEKQQIKATFFVGGSWVDKNRELFKKIVASGCEIGNHGYLHQDCAKISEDKIRDEIERTNKIIEEVGGVKCILFAPPSGSYDEKTLKVAEELGMTVVMWSKDTIDWRDKQENLVFKRATENISNGDLILMHPTQHTLSSFQNIIEEIKGEGFSLTDVSTNIKL